MKPKVDLTVDWSKISGKTSARAAYFERSPLTVEQKLSAFPKYVDRTSISRFLVKNHIFQKVLNTQGSIVECGVHFGGGLMAWANLSAIYEPLNHRRRVIGFDTFEGFPIITEQDKVGLSSQAVIGGYCGGNLEDLNESINIYDQDRPLSQIPKVEIVKGDFIETCENYLINNPHLVISLLYLDFDVYQPTAHALRMLLPRVPKGGIVAFDELHVEEWPGETQALQDVIGISNTKLERLPFSSICWWQI